jgi:hypothetical protein
MSVCFGTSRGLSHDSLSTTSPRAGSSSTTSPTLRVQVPRLVTRLVIDYFDYAAHPGASARRAARRRLLRLCRASGCLGTSRSSSLTTSTTPHVQVPRHVARLVTRRVALLVIDYSAYAARPGASACRTARHAARHANRRRLLRLRRVSGCLGTSCDSSRGLSRLSSPTTSPTPRVWVPRYVARLVTRLVVDYFHYDARSGASACRAARHAARRAARRRLLHLHRVSGCLITLRGSSSTT